VQAGRGRLPDCRPGRDDGKQQTIEKRFFWQR
jgi:hypothetical protein